MVQQKIYEVRAVRQVGRDFPFKEIKAQVQVLKPEQATELLGNSTTERVGTDIKCLEKGEISNGW